MNIFNKKPEDEKYVGAMRRGTAVAIDVWIVLFIRIMAMQTMGHLWINQMIIDFLAEFKEKFGTETIKNTPEHLEFIIHHAVFINAIIFYLVVLLVGAIYYAYFNSSAWQGTIGKRLTKIMMVKENELRVSFKRAFLHYLLSLLPFIFLIYLVAYQGSNDLNFYQAIIASELNIFFGILFVLWVQIHLFTKKRTTAYDMILRTIVIKGKTDAKWPWTKINN